MAMIVLAIWLLLVGAEGLGLHGVPGQVTAVLALLAGLLLLVGR